MPTGPQGCHVQNVASLAEGGILGGQAGGLEDVAGGAGRKYREAAP
jgi:hypothetical protein